MCIKAEVKYMLWDLKKSVGIFYLVIFLVFVFISSINIFYSDSSGHVSGGEISSLIFLFIIGLNSFKNNFGFLLSNGRSRKRYLASFIISALILCGFMSLVDNTINIIGARVYSFSLYSGIIGLDNFITVSGFVGGVLWTFALYLLAVLTGLLLTTLYYRMGKYQKTAFSIGVPLLFMVVLPYIDANYLDWKISKSVAYFLTDILGFANGGSPYISMVFFVAVAAVMYGFTYLLVRRAPLKQQ